MIHQSRKKKRLLENDRKSTIKAIGFISIIVLIFGIIIVKIIQFCIPYVKSIIISQLFTEPKSPFYNDNMNVDFFLKRYVQKSAVIFPSSTNITRNDLLILANAFECEVNEEMLCSTNHVMDDFSLSKKIVNQISNNSLNKISFQFPSLIDESDRLLTLMLCNGSSELMVQSKRKDSMMEDDISMFPTFEQHTHMWEDLWLGRKRWFLYHPSKLPKQGFNPSFSIYHWLLNVYPTLTKAEKPNEFTQEVGETVYIPQGWYQASIPIGNFDTRKLGGDLNNIGYYFSSDSYAVSHRHSSLHPEIVYRHQTPKLYNSNISFHYQINSHICIGLPNVEVADASDDTDSGIDNDSKFTKREDIISQLYIVNEAITEMNNNNSNRALELLVHGLTLGNNYNLLFHLGKVYKLLGNISNAIKSFEFSIQANKLNAAAYVELIDIHLESFMFDNAYTVYSNAVSVGLEGDSNIKTRGTIFKRNW
jgi:hypothetical protein